MARIEDARLSGRFLNADDRAALTGCPVSIVSLRDDPDNRYQGKPQPRWIVGLAVVATGETCLLSLGSNPARDDIFRRLSSFLDAGETIDPVILYRQDGADPAAQPFWSFRSATAEETADPAAPEWPAEVDAPAEPVKLPGERLRKAGAAK